MQANRYERHVKKAKDERTKQLLEESSANELRDAEILGIEQQKLEDAFVHARSEMQDKAPRQRPSNRNPGLRGTNSDTNPEG